MPLRCAGRRGRKLARIGGPRTSSASAIPPATMTACGLSSETAPARAMPRCWHGGSRAARRQRAASRGRDQFGPVGHSESRGDSIERGGPRRRAPASRCARRRRRSDRPRPSRTSKRRHARRRRSHHWRARPTRCPFRWKAEWRRTSPRRRQPSPRRSDAICASLPSAMRRSGETRPRGRARRDRAGWVSSGRSCHPPVRAPRHRAHRRRAPYARASRAAGQNLRGRPANLPTRAPAGRPHRPGKGRTHLVPPRSTARGRCHPRDVPAGKRSCRGMKLGATTRVVIMTVRSRRNLCVKLAVASVTQSIHKWVENDCKNSRPPHGEPSRSMAAVAGGSVQPGQQIAHCAIVCRHNVLAENIYGRE